jgi:hypothetical protein
MTHSTRKNLARIRTAYTGESYQQAAEALRYDRIALPTAHGREQQKLESLIMVALASSGGSAPRGWMAKKRSWTDELTLTIKMVRPKADGLELYVPRDLLWAFLQCMPLPDDHRRSAQKEGDFQLADQTGNGHVTVRSGPGKRGVRHRGSTYRLGFVHCYPGMSMNPRWACNSTEIEYPQCALVGSEMLRRAAIFFGKQAGEWVTTWRDIYLLGPRYDVDWLPDPVPPALAEALAHPIFGIHIPKPTELPPDYTNNQRTRNPSFLAGPELDKWQLAR